MAQKQVEITNFKFNDGNPVIISVGDSVVWHNNDATQHNAQHDAAPTFATKLLAQGESSDPITFSQATTSAGIEYVCQPHRTFMKGILVVSLPGSHAGSYTAAEAMKAHQGHSAAKS
jgi:plastocyanin